MAPKPERGRRSARDARSCQRSGDGGARALARGFYARGRFCRPQRRSRRRQDGVRARLPQGLDRRSRSRSAEPDLHAGPNLRRSGVSRRPRRFPSPARRRGTHAAWLGRDHRGRRRAGRMARTCRLRVARGPAGDRAVVRSLARRRIPPRRVHRARRDGGALQARARDRIPARRRRLGGGAARAAARRRLDARVRAADRRATAGPRS